MKAVKRFEREFSGFSGRVSGFGDPEFMRPVHTASVAAVNHRFPSVRQPILETPASDRLAAVKHQTELP